MSAKRNENKISKPTLSDAGFKQRFARYGTKDEMPGKWNGPSIWERGLRLKYSIAIGRFADCGRK
ncbi:hypothetical protein [Bradyrhizobium sp. USDA 4451]